jgi:hypothetical protein
MIVQAWEKHVADRKRISTTASQVNNVYEAMWEKEMQDNMNEVFLASLTLPSSNPAVAEVYTYSQRVTQEAQRRGHLTGPPMSLETGWDFLNPLHRRRALHWVRTAKPFFLMLAFPCNFFTSLLELNPPAFPEEHFKRGLTLLRFALRLAEEQIAGGRHYILENPAGSKAWRLEEVQQWLKRVEALLVKFDQCQLGLRCCATGLLHMKPTRFATSSQTVISRFLNKRCKRNHLHAQVIGGSKITSPAGRYPSAMARAIVQAVEDQFELDYGRRLVEVEEPYVMAGNEALALEDELDAEVEAGGGEQHDDAEDGGQGFEFIHEDSGSDVEVPDPPHVSAATMQAVKRLHENTGHRSMKRLARALMVSGAPLEAVVAAKNLRCSVCSEQKRMKPPKPASLPVPKDVNDQVHIDLFQVMDAGETNHFIVHMTDYTSRYQLAGVLQNKSTGAVVSWIKQHWLPLLGPPRVLVCDQGREFVSHEFETFCAGLGIYVYYTAIGSPWQNGIAERSGGTLKAILSAQIVSHSVIGSADLMDALGEATMAYNMDIGDSGFSPLQVVTGRQPRLHGDVLGGIQQRLGEHSLISSSASMARTIAMRETAKLAMVRLHFSRGLRRAELARSRNTTVTSQPAPGEMVYFYRFQKYKGRQAKRVLALRRWHGPALLVAWEGPTNCFVSHKGQLVKCSAEHIRRASSLEQIAAGAWEEAISECIAAAVNDKEQQKEQQAKQPQQQGAPSGPQAAEGPGLVPEAAVGGNGLGLDPSNQGPAGGLDLPPVRPSEFVAVAHPAPSIPSSVAPTPTSPLTSPDVSRRASTATASGDGGELTAAPGTPVPDLILTAGRRRGLPMSSTLERAREVDERGVKRPAEVDAGDFQRQAQADAQFEQAPAASHGSSTLDFEDGGGSAGAFMQESLEVTREQLLEWATGTSQQHPLLQVQALAALDRLDPELHEVNDHGSWDGRWQLPSRSQWEIKEALGQTWPCGKVEYEAQAVQAARKEFTWSKLDSQQKDAFREACKSGWQVWSDNGAVEVLDPATSKRVIADLRRRGEMSKLLTPRWVMTDKNDGLRTANNQLPLKANSRLVVPGYQDESAYGLRKDAPTGSRLSQHILFVLTASNFLFGWRLHSADIKSAFMKGERYLEGAREIYLRNVGGPSDMPRLPFSDDCICKIVKGVFGLADAPRQWYLRLNRALLGRGWQRSPVDHACWFLWKKDDPTSLHGMIISHVDDLLMGGDDVAVASLKNVGQELGFGAYESDEFVYCGKRIRQDLNDGTIYVTMEEYHANLQPVKVFAERKKDLSAELNAGELKQLRGLLGSMQWMVAQVDMGFHLSALQGEKPCVGTLLRANALLKRFKEKPGFGLTFRPMNLKDAGIMVVTDSSLGNVRADGTVGDEPLERLYSQSCYFVLFAEKTLMDGKRGKFALLDGRSHRLARVCRSTFAAELLGGEEAFDIGQFVRGHIAAVLGYPMLSKNVDASTDAVALTVVTDAKDFYDKGTSDTPSYGSQKSLAFTVAWIRAMLGRANTSLRWTSTENMFVDSGTKDMDMEHMHRILTECEWCAKYTAAFIKQTSKGNKQKSGDAAALATAVLGEPLPPDDALLPHLLKLSDCTGWHDHGDVGINVARNAKSFRVPFPRFEVALYPFRSTYARFDFANGHCEWRRLENHIDFMQLANPQKLFGQKAAILVTMFHRCDDPQPTKE